MPYSYATSNYAAGDAYGTGSHYAAGGLFGSIGKFLGGVAKRALPFVPLVGQPLSQALQAVAPAPPNILPGIPGPGGGMRMLGPGTGVIPRTGGSMAEEQMLARQYQGRGLVCGPTGRRGHLNRSSYYVQTPGNPQIGQLIEKGTVCVPNRRMNVANVKAFRKAERRVAGMAKLARRSFRWVSPKAPGRPFIKTRKRRSR